MFEKLFGKVSDVVHHTIGPYSAERRQFLEYCRQQGYRRTTSSRSRASCCPRPATYSGAMGGSGSRQHLNLEPAR